MGRRIQSSHSSNAAPTLSSRHWYSAGLRVSCSSIYHPPSSLDRYLMACSSAIRCIGAYTSSRCQFSSLIFGVLYTICTLATSATYYSSKGGGGVVGDGGAIGVMGVR